MKFKRDTLKNKKNFYLILISIEIIVYITLFFTNIHWVFLLLIFPFLCIEIISNKRALTRQKNFITHIEFNNVQLSCMHLNDATTLIDFENLVFSFREIKFEKDKSEIEIKKKGRFRNKLVGRIHINNWKNIFEIKNEFLKNEITRVKFKPAGFWNKYAGLTADVVIISTALVLGEDDDVQGGSNLMDVALQSNFNNLHKEHKNKAST